MDNTVVCEPTVTSLHVSAELPKKRDAGRTKPMTPGRGVSTLAKAIAFALLHMQIRASIVNPRVHVQPKKRIRVRSKPLTAADIVPGGVYVPKRGNDKTPRITVIDTEGQRVRWTQHSGKVTPDARETPIDEFLTLVARRVQP